MFAVLGNIVLVLITKKEEECKHKFSSIDISFSSDEEDNITCHDIKRRWGPSDVADSSDEIEILAEITKAEKYLEPVLNPAY